ncbi:MAG: hypothetical protein ACRC4O_02470, partial [Giesbergeria sp.]
MSELIFHGRIPDGFWYDADHNMWLQRAGNEVVVGGPVQGGAAHHPACTIGVAKQSARVGLGGFVAGAELQGHGRVQG